MQGVCACVCLHMMKTVTYLPLSVTEKTSRKPSPVLMYCSLMAPNSSCPAVSRTREHEHVRWQKKKVHTHTHRVAHSKINFWNQFLKCNRLQDKGATCASLYLRICTGRVYSAKCTYCRAWPAFRRSHTAWYKSLQLSGHSQWQSTTVGGKENDNKGG